MWKSEVGGQGDRESHVQPKADETKQYARPNRTAYKVFHAKQLRMGIKSISASLFGSFNLYVYIY